MIRRLLPALALAASACATPTAPSTAAAELARVERQLKEFYGPLLFLVEESRLSIQDVLDELKRDRVFPENGTLTEAELRFWLFRVERDLMPRNEEMAALVRAKGGLAEGEALASELRALVEHQDSWRELHRRWKETGVAYEWHSKTPFPRGLGAALRKEFARLKTRHAELLKQVPGAELRFVELQIRKLYAPLVQKNHEGNLAYLALLGELGRENAFPLNPARHDEELKLWHLWCKEALFPRNEETRRLIASRLYLVEGTAPPATFLAFVDHWNTWKLAHARWTEQGVAYGWRSKRGYPGELNEEVEAAWRSLKARQVRLRGAASPP